AVRVLELLLEARVDAAYYDPHVPEAGCNGRSIHSLTAEALARERFDCAVLLTPHTDVDYERVVAHAGPPRNTRNHRAARPEAAVVPIELEGRQQWGT